MKNTSLFRRSLSVILALTMLFSLLAPVASAEPTKAAGNQVRELTLKPSESGAPESLKLGRTSEKESIPMEDHALTEKVRVSIFLDRASTIDAGFSLDGIANNTLAKVYRTSLRIAQDAMTARIEKAIGSKLDVQWNLTLAANCISANVLYGQIETIQKISGVRTVVLEPRYEVQKDEKEAERPNNGASSHMIGSHIAWAAGLTGAGSRLAVIDTGIDVEHQSFSGEALEYAFARTAEEKGMSYDEYVASLNLLDAEKVNAVKDQLNVKITGEKAYVSTKIPYAYCYVDQDYDVTHENDTEGEHGSHVEGISAANRFVKIDGEFKDALEAVGTQGVAPDAQIITMKVFGNGGGAYATDYMAAIEDAIILGCDSANLSLGSSAPGFGFTAEFDQVMNKLVESGMVCSISMGNAYGWYDNPAKNDMYPYLYTDDVSYHTGGSPGTFTNSLAVASSKNSGQYGPTLMFGDRMVIYNESTAYGNEAISTLGDQELEYVLVDGVGVDDNDHVGQEGDQFLALGSEVLSGKVAMCYRGSSSFFAKANAAVAQGAVAVLIINNQDGAFGMNLTGYEHTAPVVALTKVDGDAIKADSTPVTDGEGNVLYYTGSMRNGEGSQIQYASDSDTLDVSEFSSYGVPGTLVMKPEILAPGGSIYSVAGKNLLSDGSFAGGHDQYELMSGTSMAAPQINGMAGIMGQYIRENELCQKTGLSQRQLINSLLMSTAHPVYDADGNYWPTIRVGAGHANVADAVSAKSYILMDENATLFPDTAKDGKVKVELGDDPERVGKYDFSFTVTPMEGEKEFTLRTDIFTQGIAGNGGYGLLEDTATMLIGANTTYDINGKTYENSYRVEADVNMDGETDAADAQAILDHITGEEAEGAKFDAEAADVDGDGKITTYDAKLLLDSAESPVVKVTEATQVKVHFELDEGDLEALNYYFPKGFYVQGYTYVEPVADEEGAMDVTHSIPILGYYGSWTEPSMFDRTSAIDDAYGTGKKAYVSATNNINYMLLKDPKGNTSVFMGNPYVIEDEFPADRLAINSQATIASFNYLNIRNIATLGFAVQNEKGEATTTLTSPANKASAFYNSNTGKWMNTAAANFSIGKKVSALNLKEGDKATIGMYALPEYSAIQLAKRHGEIAKRGTLSGAELAELLEAGLVGDGTAIKYDFTVDDTAPVVEGAFLDLITGNITVRAHDNRYIAYIGVTNKSGSKIYAGMVPEQTEPGQEVELPLNLEGQKVPSTALLVVGDYAGNEAVFTMSLSNDNGNSNAGATIAFTSAANEPGQGNRALQIDIPTLTYDDQAKTYTGLEVFSSTPFAVEAAEYVDGYVFMAADDGCIYASELEAMDAPEYVGRFDGTTSVVYDMAFNSKDNKLYVLGENNTLYTMDYYTGVLTKVAQISLSKPSAESDKVLKGLAIDDEGNFYSANCASMTNCYLYRFTLDMVQNETINALDPVSNSLLGAYNQKWGGSMAWDHSAKKLYMVSNYFFQYGNYGDTEAINVNSSSSNCLWVINTETGRAERANAAGTATTSAVLNNACSGLIIVPGEASVIQPTDTATGIEAVPAELKLLKGQSVDVSVNVLPWILKDKSVTWASKDETVATVMDGRITGVEVGETTVTATTVAQPNLSVDISVSVSEVPDTELRGIIWDVDATPYAAHFNVNDTKNWEGDAKVVNLQWGALVGDTVYGSTADTLFRFDADTYEVESIGGIVSDWIPSDAAALPENIAAKLGHKLIGLCSNGTYLEVLNPEMGKLNYWDLSSDVGDDPMALITYMGSEDFTDSDGILHPDSASYLVMTESGKLVMFHVSQDGTLSFQDYGETSLDLSGVSDVSNEIFGSMCYDEASNYLFVALFNGSDEDAHLYAIDASNPSAFAELGTFNEKVWPVVGLYQYEPLTDLTLKVEPESIDLFEGETAELKIRVKLGETNEYTVEAEDPSICSIDENGVVTALKEGETTLTVTTVDTNEAGEQLSKKVAVKVKGLTSVEAFVGAQVTDSHGARFTRISLDGAIASKKGEEAPGNVSSGARGGKIYLAGMGTQTQVLDSETFKPTDSWNGVGTAYSDFPAQDMANYPSFSDAEGNLNEQKFLFTTSVGYLVTPNYHGWNLSSAIPDMAGICFAGLDGDEEGNSYYVYFLITTAGVLYQIVLDPLTGEISYAPTLETGLSFKNANDVSMALVESLSLSGTGLDLGAAGLAVADNGTKNVYFINLSANTEDEVVNKIGTMDAENVSGLIGNFDNLDYAELTEPGPNPEPGFVPHYVGDQIAASFFEENPADEGWSFVNKDGDEYNWIWTPESDRYSDLPAYEGTGMIISNSYDNDHGALTPDNWAISPAFDLSNAADDVMFAMFAKGQDPSYADEKFAVYVGTTANPDEMELLIPETTVSGNWVQYTASLANYIGQSEVYVAIRHFNVTDMFILDVDQVEILENVEFVETEPENPDPENPDPENPDPEEPDPEEPGVAVYLNAEFESDPAVDGWTFVDADNNGNTWGWNNNSYPSAMNGSGCIYVYDGDNGQDNWAVSPAMNLVGTTAPTLTLYAQNFYGSQDTFAIYAGTSADTASMTKITEDMIPGDDWTEYTVDLSAYVGESTVYVAIRHYNSSDAFRMVVDSVKVQEAAAPNSIKRVAVRVSKAEVQFNAENYKVPELKLSRKQLGDGFSMLNSSICSEPIQMVKVGETTKVAGSTNAIRGELKTNVPVRKPVDETKANNGKATIALSDDENTTNGLMLVTYDPEAMTFVEGTSSLPYISLHHEIVEASEESEKAYGKITIAYASKTVIPAETVIDTLTFSYEGAIDTKVQVTTLERNDNVAVKEEPVEISVVETPHEHAYGEPEWSWNEELTAATAKFSCECGDVQSLEAEISEEVIKEAAAHVAGEKKLTAKVTFEGKEYTDEKTAEIAALPCPCECFKDMPEYGTVEHAAIDWAYTQDPKVTNGTSSTKFSPNDTVTRGQAVRFLWNAVGQPKPASTENPFKDAVQGRYYYDAMLWAYHNDPQITNGTSKTKFEPESTLLRSQIITFLWRTVGCPEPSIENPYSDVPAGRFFEKPAIWAYETGIFKGENGKFEPNAACTRADTVVFLYRHYTHQDLAE